MPTISQFFGIVIAMYFDDHHPPHFHAKYNEFEAEVAIDTGEILEGRLPKTAGKLVEQWRKQHVADLKANWDLAKNLKLPASIEPLE